MTTHRHRLWRPLFVLAGVAMAYGGSLHPDADAEDSLRDELATMTADDTWVRSHVFLAVGTFLLALGLWSAVRRRSWPVATHRALRVAAITMSLYVVETVFHLASVIDSDALADGDAAPIAFTHVALALVLYPVSGLSFAWLNIRLVRSVSLPRTPLAGLGVFAGLVHACSVPMTIVFPDAELTAMFAGAGMMFAVWSIGFGLFGLGADSPSEAGPGSDDANDANHADRAASYRAAESALWGSLGVEPTERVVDLPRLGARVRVQEIGDGAPVLFVHGGPSAGTTWAPLVGAMHGFRCIVVDRPGTGLSERLAVSADNLDAFADTFVVDLLDGLGVERAHVVGSSFGGFLALRAAAVAPHRFGRMVQMACPAGASGMVVPMFMRAATVRPLRRLITSLPPNERAARSMLRQIGHGASLDAGRFTPEFMEWYLSLQRDTPTMRNDMDLIGSIVTARGAMHPALAMSDDLLGSIDVPASFYWGADDPFGGTAVAEAIVGTMGDARLEMVAGAGHLPWLDDPVGAAMFVDDFLRGEARLHSPDATLTVQP